MSKNIPTNENQSAVITNTASKKKKTAQQVGAQALKTAEMPNTSIATNSMQAFANQSAEDTQKQISEQGYAVQEFIKQGLEAKQQSLPYQQKIAKVNRKIGKLSINDYKGIPIEQALGFMREDLAQYNAEKSFYQSKMDENAKSASELVDSIANMLNSQLQAVGLRIENDWKQKQFDEQQRQFNVSMANRGSGSVSSAKQSSIDPKNLKIMLQGTGTALLIDSSKNNPDGSPTILSDVSQQWNDYIGQKQDQIGQSFTDEHIQSLVPEFQSIITGYTQPKSNPFDQAVEDMKQGNLKTADQLAQFYPEFQSDPTGIFTQIQKQVYGSSYEPSTPSTV